jgi:hypothetical protein
MTKLVDAKLGLTTRDERSGVDQSELYRSAFERLYDLKGPDVAGSIIRQGVIQAVFPPLCREEERLALDGNRDACRRLELDSSRWDVPPGARALAALIGEFPERFDSRVLTTNFDPLIAIALRLARCQVAQTILNCDGNPDQTEVAGAHVIYLHGYWHGYEGLHTQRQLMQTRPRLQAFLERLVRNCTIVTLAYSGWDDIFTTAIEAVAREQDGDPDILWTFYPKSPPVSALEEIYGRVAHARATGRIRFYSGVDCHQFLPQLLLHLRQPYPQRPAASPVSRPRSNSATTTTVIGECATLQSLCWHKGNWTLGTPCAARWMKSHGFLRIEHSKSLKARKPNESAEVWIVRSSHGPQMLVYLWSNSSRIDQGEHGEPVQFPRRKSDCQWLDGIIKLPCPYLKEANCLCNTEENSTRIDVRGVDDSGIAEPILPCWTGVESKRHGPDAIAARLMPAAPGDLTPETVAGSWLKLSTEGGVFLDRLDKDSRLVERYVFDPLRGSKRGRWSLDIDNQLHISISSWKLETTQRLQALADWSSTGASLDLFEATECDDMGISCLRRVPFLLARIGAYSADPG